ncbi:uncharacterized protein [Acropora muricata]|uniref:uncharacterized protein n=1 Tax=Acropora muricata TaxID=159855 RepID=UPI0034E4EE05
MKRVNHPGLETSPCGKANPDTPHLHRASPEFYYRAVPYEVKTEVKEEGNSSQRSDEDLLTEIFKVQYEQLQTTISSRKQLATAVTLPQPEVPKFSGDPTKYKTFIIAFDARIRARVANNADRLYYLDQHLTGEPKDLIGGCLHLEPDVGYKEARRLLDKEYGDPYEVSNAFIQRLSDWPVLKYDDGPSLKRFSLFITKCNNAMKAITHMSVLNHPPNMQSVVQKLPNNLQTKWREIVVKCRIKDGRIAGFEDLSKFVEFAAESANDPIYSKDALANTRAKPAPPSGVDHYKKINTAKPKSTSFATNVDASTQSPSLHRTGSSRRDAVVPHATEAKSVRCLLCHEGFKGKSSVVDSAVVEELIVSDPNGTNPIELPRAYTTNEIPVQHEQIPTREVVGRIDHLKEIAGEIPLYDQELDIGLLIGNNCPTALVPLKVVPNEGDGPFAVRLHHGWTVSGPLHIVATPITNKITANRITVREIENVKETITPELLLQLFELAFNDMARRSKLLSKRQEILD